MVIFLIIRVEGVEWGVESGDPGGTGKEVGFDFKPVL